MKIKQYQINNKKWFSEFEETCIANLVSDCSEEFFSRLDFPYADASHEREIVENLKMSRAVTDSSLEKYKDSSRIICDTRHNDDGNGRFSGILGNAFSYFIFEEMGRNWMAIFDVGDGSGSHPESCHLRQDALQDLISENKVEGIIPFKREVSDIGRLMEFYPIENKHLIPIGLPGDSFQEKIEIKKRTESLHVEKDIDVLFIGDFKDSHSQVPNCAVNKLDWPYYWRKKGIDTLSKIRDKRKDLNIVCSTDKVSKEEYLSLIFRSKICVDIPGFGWLTRRFTELLIFEKCVIRMDPRIVFPYPLKKGVHYHSCGLNYDSLEKDIDYLLKNPSMIKQIESNLKDFQCYLSPEYTLTFIENNIRFKIKNILSMKN